MMLDLFTWLSTTLNAEPLFALTAALLWGIAGVLLSPCHLSSIPLIIGYISDRGEITVKRAFTLSILFALGILITIAVIGFITGLMGKMIGDIGPYGNYFVATIFFLVGLYLLGVIRLPSFGGGNRPSMERKGFLGAFILGLLFGIALGPCTFAYMMPVLGAAFAVSSTKFYYSSSLVLTYAIGHCSVIALAGAFTGAVQRYLNWNEKSKKVDILKKICGILVILGGVYLLLSAK